MLNYHIDPALSIPIYQQLVDEIRAAIRQGELSAGDQLPTVQDLAQQLGIARGTIKRAYDELEREKLLEKVQGRGTFVSWQPAASGNRKDQAMACIDDALDQLEQMGFSMHEINIFLNLKLRQRAERLSNVKVAVVECNPENLSQLSEQLRSVEGIEVCSYLVDTILAYPYHLTEDMDLIVTSTEHAAQLARLIPDSKRMVRIALRLTTRCFSRILRIRSNARVGILSGSQRFGQVLRNTCQSYNHSLTLTDCRVFSPELDLDAFLEDKDVVLVPKDYEKYCSRLEESRLQSFAAHKRLISCAYEMDEGSFLYLEERVRRALEEKPI